MIWGGRKTKDLVVYVKVNWHPLTNIWGQSSPELASTLFVCLLYAQNRSLDRDLFCVVSSARLPSAIHILHNSFLQRTMTEILISSGQSRIQRYTNNFILYKSFVCTQFKHLNSSIRPILNISGITTLGQSGPGVNGNDGVLYIPQSSSITEASQSDHWGGLTPVHRCSQCILQPQPTGLICFWSGKKRTLVLGLQNYTTWLSYKTIDIGRHIHWLSIAIYL